MNFQTSASASVRGYFKPLRIAGAQARRVLLDAVAAKWNVPVGELSTEPASWCTRGRGGASPTARSRLRQGSGRAAEDRGQGPQRSGQLPLHRKDVARVEVPLKVTGAAKYGMDVQVPGMVYAAVLQSPYPGGSPQTVDDAAARRVPGITDVVRLPEGVGVVGTTVEGTQAAKNLLKVTWSDAPGAHHDSERALEEFATIGRDKESRRHHLREGRRRQGRNVRSRQGVSRRISHPLCLSRPDGADERDRLGQSGRQIGRGLDRHPGSERTVERSLAPPADRACESHLHQHVLGGGFGRRGQHETVLAAVRLAKAVGKPVKLISSREDDITFGKFRPMTAHYIEAGLDSNGKVIAWHHRVVAESVVAYTSGDATPRQDRIVMKGSPIPQYPIANKLAEHVIEARGRPACPPWAWRSATATMPFAPRASSTRSRRIRARIRLPSGSHWRGPAAHADAPSRRGRNVGLEAQA